MHIHGDDSVASGAASEPQWFSKGMETHYECKMQIVGPDKTDEQSVKALNGIITWQEINGQSMMAYDADPRHAEIIISEMGVSHAKPLTSPAVEMEMDDGENDEEMTEAYTTAFRSITARANYLALDRPDTT